MVINFLIEISHQVNQATLLPAVDCIVSCIKVRHQNTPKISEHVRQEGTFSETPVEWHAELTSVTHQTYPASECELTFFSSIYATELVSTQALAASGFG
jgi:hypothetical protein